MNRLIECYDIGGTNLRGAIFNSDTDKILIKKIVETNSKLFLEQIKDVSNFMRSNLQKEFSIEDIKIISIGVPGPVKNNTLSEAPPMKIKEKINIADELRKKGILQSIYLLNDADAAVLAENYFRGGSKSMCVVTISTGIGIGTIINGKLISGGEYGHNILERNGPVCSCGRKGCWIALSSGYGIETATEKIYGRKINCKELFELYDSGDEIAIELIKKVRDYNAHGLGSIINAVCVEKIIIIGSIGLEQFDKIIPAKREIGAYTINEIPDIVPTTLGKDVGLLGAYVFAKSK